MCVNESRCQWCDKMPSLPDNLLQFISKIPDGPFTVRHKNFAKVERPASILLALKNRGLVRKVGRASKKSDAKGVPVALWEATDRLDRLRRRC